MKSINMFSCGFFWGVGVGRLQSGVPFHLKIYCGLNIEPHCFMFMYVNVNPKLWRQYLETWVFGMISCCVRRGKYIWGLCHLRRHAELILKMHQNRKKIMSLRQLRQCTFFSETTGTTTRKFSMNVIFNCPFQTIKSKNLMTNVKPTECDISHAVLVVFWL